VARCSHYAEERGDPRSLAVVVIRDDGHLRHRPAAGICQPLVRPPLSSTFIRVDRSPTKEDVKVMAK
jgi:hypothetical protein